MNTTLEKVNQLCAPLGYILYKGGKEYMFTPLPSVPSRPNLEIHTAETRLETYPAEGWRDLLLTLLTEEEIL